MKRSALSRHTLGRRKEGLMFLTFPFLEIFVFALALAFAVPTNARLSIHRWALAPAAMYWIPCSRDHDCCFELPRVRGRQGTHSQSRGSTTPQRSNRAYPACEPEALSWA